VILRANFFRKSVPLIRERKRRESNILASDPPKLREGGKIPGRDWPRRVSSSVFAPSGREEASGRAALARAVQLECAR